MVTGILGKKVGMTQVFAPDGTVTPATVIKAGPCVVTQMKTAQTDGYESVQVGLVEGRPARANKPQSGHYKKAGVPPTRIRRELTVAKGAEAPKAGEQILVNTVFNNGDRVDVIGVSRGKGFQGVMKRHNFAGGRASHGNSVSHRAHGSTGQRQDPGKVFKGKKMAGHMGSTRVTTQNVEVVSTDTDRGLILIRGAVPGSKGAWILVRDAVKEALPDNAPKPAGMRAAKTIEAPATEGAE